MFVEWNAILNIKAYLHHKIKYALQFFVLFCFVLFFHDYCFERFKRFYDYKLYTSSKSIKPREWHSYTFTT